MRQKSKKQFVIEAAVNLVVGFGLGYGAVMVIMPDHVKPHGTVTEKLWTQAVWENGEQIVPPRFCLEIDDVTETCVDVNTFNKYKIGGQYP